MKSFFIILFKSIVFRWNSLVLLLLTSDSMWRIPHFCLKRQLQLRFKLSFCHFLVFCTLLGTICLLNVAALLVIWAQFFCKANLYRESCLQPNCFRLKPLTNPSFMFFGNRLEFLKWCDCKKTQNFLEVSCRKSLVFFNFLTLIIRNWRCVWKTRRSN